jgi:hypothetical protein
VEIVASLINPSPPCGATLRATLTTGSIFSGSLWHTFWVLLSLGIVVFFVCFFSLQKGSHYFFDPKHNVDPRLKDENGDYENHSKRYGQEI